jgi:GNAT superfamily N-acetyltransferase
MSQMDRIELIEYYQQHVAHALVARVQQTEAIVGDRFGFEVLRPMCAAELDQAAQLFVQGYGYPEASAASWYDFARHGYTAPGFACFLAQVEQQPAAFGAVHVQGAIAFVDGAATLARYRGLGLQKALLAARIRYASERNCRYAFSRTGLGSISQQNMEKLGMRLIFQSTAWRRSQPLMQPG